MTIPVGDLLKWYNLTELKKVKLIGTGIDIVQRRAGFIRIEGVSGLFAH